MSDKFEVRNLSMQALGDSFRESVDRHIQLQDKLTKAKEKSKHFTGKIRETQSLISQNTNQNKRKFERVKLDAAALKVLPA